MFKNAVVKKVFLVLAVIIVGFLLLNLALVINWLLNIMLDGIIGFIFSNDPNLDWSSYIFIKYILFLVILGLVSSKVYKSKVSEEFKAVYTTVPVVFTLLTFGIILFQWEWAVIAVGAVVVLGIIYLLIRLHKNWLYYLTVIFWSLILLGYLLLNY